MEERDRGPGAEPLAAQLYSLGAAGLLYGPEPQPKSKCPVPKVGR